VGTFISLFIITIIAGKPYLSKYIFEERSAIHFPLFLSLKFDSKKTFPPNFFNGWEREGVRERERERERDRPETMKKKETIKT